MWNCWPVIVRELRAEARRPVNYWLRVAGAAAFLLAFWLAGRTSASGPGRFGGTGPLPFNQLGQVMFGYLDASLFIAIWLVVPLMTADCISRERREGTLGLLFLAPLTASGVVIGKSFTHGLRALSLCLTAVPVVALPVLLGGVSANDLLLAGLLNLGALCLALAAGLLATAVARDWVKAALVAEILSALFGLLFLAAHARGFEAAVANRPAIPGRGARVWPFAAWSAAPIYHPSGFFGRCAERFAWCTDQPTFQTVWFAPGPGVRPVTGMTGRWTQVWTGMPATVHRQWLWWAAGQALASALTLVAAVAVAARHVQRTWRAEPPSAFRRWCFEVFCTPRYWRPLFRRRMTGLLERNPVGWLQQYTWSARLTKWGWTLAVIIAELFFLADSSLNDLVVGQDYLAVLLLLSLGFSAANSFQRERETGALELLLVSPLQIHQILKGRMRGIWMQFFPPAVLLLMAWGYIHFDPAFVSVRWGTSLAQGQLPILLVGSYLSLPMVGLYFSLSRRNVMLAWALTCGVGLGLPLLFYTMGVWLQLGTSSHYPVPPGGGLAPQEIEALATYAVGLQVLIAGLAGWLAWRFLAQRRFLSL